MKKNKIIASIVATVFVAIALVATTVFFIFGPISLFNSTQKRYIVSEETTIEAVAVELETMGIIRSSDGLKLWSQFTKRTTIPEGIYVFTTQMPIFEIGDILTDGRDSNERVLTFVEGATIPEVAMQIAAVLDMQPEDVLSQVDDKEWLKTLVSEYWFLSDQIFAEGIKHPLEGYLAANTYFVQVDSSVQSVITRLLDQTGIILEPYKSQIEKFPLSLHEVLTLASIVEREASEFADRQMVTGVFMNRLDEQMTLGSDVTVAYAVGKVALNFTIAELQTESPYNTYVITGLPIGPVGNPSAMAIESVLDYKENEYLYFLADVCSDGTVYYAKTYEEHLALRTQYLGCIDE